jgi:cyanophycin synthetase
VLNATDPLVAAMAERCGGRTLYFAIDGDQPVMARHRAAGGATIFVRDGVIVLSHDGIEDEMARLEDIPMTFNGRIYFEVENALAAIGAAWAMGVPQDLVREQSTGFSTNMHDTPGRFNIIDVRGATVIVDYGHNAHALRAIIDALDNFPQPKRTALYSMAGDRRDSDIVHIGELLGDSFDHVIMYEACTVRGRPPGAIAELMRQGLEKGSRVEKFESVNGHHTSMEFALDSVGPGEVLLLQADVIDETVDFVRDYLRRTSVLA